MNGSIYVPVQQFTGEQGPEFPFYTLAAWWIAVRRDSPAWRVEQFRPPPAPAAVGAPSLAPAFA